MVHNYNTVAPDLALADAFLVLALSHGPGWDGTRILWEGSAWQSAARMETAGTGTKSISFDGDQDFTSRHRTWSRGALRHRP